jgi:hypothetical protein
VITSWSHSKTTDFEKCRFLAWLKHDQKIPEPERPLPPGKTEHANDRGTRIHTHAENFVNGIVDHQIPEMGKFAAEFDHLRHLFTKGLVSLEGEWAVNKAWEVTPWAGEWQALTEPHDDDPVVKVLPERGREDQVVRVGKKGTSYIWVPAWHRSKVDSIVFPDPTEAIIIDYKSGKKFGNEIKHSEQTQLYALNAALRYPKLELITTELWYLDQDDLTRNTFRRDQILRFKAGWDKRGTAITTCTDFPPNPNVFTCQYCQYGPWNGNQCTVGVQRGK